MAPEEAIRHLLESLGVDPEMEELKETPQRYAKALVEMVSGYAEDETLILKKFDCPEYDGVVVVRDVAFSSLCAHHLMPFHGVAHVGYWPVQRVIGLSKIPRLVSALSRRLQLQERLTAQITRELDCGLLGKGSACVIEATHTCLCARGIKSGAKMVTSSLTGVFRSDSSVRKEFFSLIRG